MDVIEKTANERYRESIRVKQGIYTICFVLLCLIDQIMGSAMGRVQFVAANCTGLIIAVIIFTGYRWKDFIRLPYAVWTVFCVLGGSFAIRWGQENYDHFGRWITALLNIAVYGYLVLRIFIQICVEKKMPRMNWRYFTLWVVMMLCMVFSRNESVWPLWFLVMFGCFYLTEYRKEELNALFNGMLNGIIIGFCILQGFATMFRAFDEIGYTGMYTNKNMNALFYLLVHAAILGKWYRLKKNGVALGWRLLAGAGSGILFTYCFLTLCRTATIVMLLNTILLIGLFFFQEEKKRLLKAVGRMAIMLLVAVISFPVVFYSVRRIPAEFYSAMILAGDPGYKIQGAVPSWDERYIEMDEFLKAAFGALFWFLQFGEEEEGSDVGDIIGGIGSFLAPSLKVQAAEEISEENFKEKRPWGSGLEQSDPVLTDIEDIVNPVKIRWAIYKTYLGRLNFSGHKNSEEGVWVAESYYAPHAHNFLLQVMFSHGVLSGILFLAVIVIVFMHFVMQCLREPKGEWFFAVGILIVSSFVGFGTLEIDWRIGQLAFTMLFIGQYLLFHRCEAEMR